MKKMFIVLALFVSTLASAQHFHYRHYPSHGYIHGSGWEWVAPLVIGGTIGYALANRPAHVEPPIIVQPSKQVVINGVLYYKQLVYFEDCRCYREVLTNVVTLQ